MSKECPICGKAFELVPGKNKQKYCTKECAAEAGRMLSKERKKQHRQEKKLQQELAPIVNTRIIDMVSEARDKNMSYGELAALQQAKAVKIIRQPLQQNKQTHKTPAATKKVIYEYRRIQFDECVDQWLYNEEHKMDERIKKMKIADLEILNLKVSDIVRDIIDQLPDESFDDDYNLVIAFERYEVMYRDLVEVIKKIC